MNRPESGNRWWISATRPATEFSIGIMPRSASPDEIAASASSKVGQGSACASGYASAMAMWEFAPGSPWNAIFFGLLVVLAMAPCISRSRFGKYLAGGFQVGRGIDPARHGVDNGDVDPHSRLQRPQLLQFLLKLERRGRQPDKPLQRRAAIGIKADVMVAWPLAVRRGGAGEIKRAQPPWAEGSADRLHHVGVQSFFLGMDFGG